MLNLSKTENGRECLLQQFVVTKSESLLKQHREHDSEYEQPSLLCGAVLVADLNCDEPHKRRQQQRHQPEKCPTTQHNITYTS